MNGSSGADGGRGKRPTDFVPFEKSAIEQSVPGRFEQMVARYPDRLAVKARSRALTYVQLDESANRIAHAVLECCGSGPAPIALLLEHGMSFIPALLGVLKAGKFYAPIDSALPPARAADLLSDLETRLILTNDANLSAARALAGGALEVINIDALAGGRPADHPRVAVSPGDPRRSSRA